MYIGISLEAFQTSCQNKYSFCRETFTKVQLVSLGDKSVAFVLRINLTSDKSLIRTLSLRYPSTKVF